MRTTRRTSRLAAAVGGLLLLGAVGCANGSNTEEDFDAWHDDHPVAGTSLVDRSATDSIFGHGEFSATYDLTATPSERAIRAAMKGACGFNGETKASTSYVLVVEKVTMEVACRPENQVKVAHFWSAVKDLPLSAVTFNQGRVDTKAASVPAAVAADVLDTLIKAGTADDLIGDGTYAITDTRTLLSVRTESYSGFGRELQLVHRILEVTPPGSVQRINAFEGEVLARTEAPVRRARAWEDEATGVGERLLAVSSVKTNLDRPLPVAGRDLVDAIAVRPAVTSLDVRNADWSVNVADRDTADALLTELTGTTRAAGVRDLGDLQLGIFAPGQTGSGGCRVTAGLPDVAPARTLLDLCSLPDTTVTPFGDHPQVSTPDTSLPRVVKVLHELPRGTKVSIRRTGVPYASVDLVVDAPLQVSGTSERKYAAKVQKLWNALGPLS